MSRCNAGVCESYLPESPLPSWPLARASILKTLQTEAKSYWREKVAPLVMQGDFLKLLEQENGDLTWRSIIIIFTSERCFEFCYQSFNQLPTNSRQLETLGEKMNSRCHICGNHETLFHILNNCKTALTQGRYNYRHDSVVSYLVNVCQILNNVDKVIEVYADIKGHTVNGGTIPQDIVVTSSRPDIVLVDRGNEEFILAELTCPF